MINKLPAGTVVWIEQKTSHGTYLITSNQSRTTYTLYKVIDGKYEKVMSAKEPTAFDSVLGVPKKEEKPAKTPEPDKKSDKKPAEKPKKKAKK